MRIFLCRHGETYGDIEDRYGGDYEDHLTRKGRKQARDLANKLTGKNIEVIFSSPKIRAVQAAEILKEKLGVEIKITGNLRERNHYGILTGMIKSVAKEKFPDEVERVKSYLTSAENSEEYEVFKKRVEEVWEKLLQSKHKTILAVSHSGLIREVFRGILNLGEIKIGEGAFAEIEAGKDGTEIINLDGIKLDSTKI